MNASDLSWDLCLSLGNFHLQASAKIPTQGITVLFGRSGCGKTTVLRAILGLEPSVRGHLRLGSSVWFDSAQKVWIPTAKRRIGCVFQHGALFPHLSVQANLAYGFCRRPPENTNVELSTVAQQCGITHLLPRRIDSLSGGERQRVALARTLAASPKLLLLDEPMASLDRKGKRELLPLIRRIHEEWQIPVLYVTHDLDEVARIGDRVIEMAEGRVIGQDKIQTFLTRPDALHANDACALAVIECTVTNFDVADHLLHLEFAGGTLRLPAPSRPVQQNLRVAIHARDVSLSLGPSQNSTVLNCLPVTITGIQKLNEGRVLVHLLAGKSILLAHITSHSVHALALAPGQTVHAQIKATALLD